MTIDSNAKYQRKLSNFLLNPLLQVRFGLYSVVLNSIFSVVIIIVLYFSMADILEMINQLTNQHTNIKELFEEYMSAVKLFIIGAILFFFVSNIALSIVYTHRMVGPVVAFRHQLSKLIDGNYQDRVLIRKKDAFHDLADDINKLTETLEQKYGSQSKQDS